MIWTSLKYLALAIGLSNALPAEDSPTCGSPVELNNLTGRYTLTAYAPGNVVYHGLKVNNLNLFQEKVFQYCPFTGNQSSYCPNGTDMAFGGTLGPIVTVPGGQDLYVDANGQLRITVQHSHWFPTGSYPSYYGWKWEAFPVHQLPVLGCPSTDPLYNCEPPTGIFTFKAPNATVGGVLACPSLYGGNGTADTLWARTPQFNRTGCVEISGLGTHLYTGVSPPVWAYYG